MTSAAGPWNDHLGRAATRSAQALLVLIVATAAVVATMKLTLVVIPLLLALILTAAIAPVVRSLKHRGFAPGAAVGASFLGLLVVFGGIITGIIAAVRWELPGLIAQAGQGLDQVHRFLLESSIPMDEESLVNARKALTGLISSPTVGSGALTGISAVASFVAGSVLMAVVLFYFLKDGSKIWSFLISPLRADRRAKARLSGIRTMEVLGGYVRGTALVAAVDAVCIGGALVLLQVPLALPLAVLTFVGGFIPLVGATAAGALAVLVAMVSNGPVGAIAVAAVVIAVNQLEGNLLQPVLMSKVMNIHALVILIALAAGTILAGIIGAVLAVPLAAVAWTVIKIWVPAPQSALTLERAAHSKA